jgi:hypothetical protein
MWGFFFRPLNYRKKRARIEKTNGKGRRDAASFRKAKSEPTTTTTTRA